MALLREQAGLFSAAEIGASHQRRWLFIVAHADKVPLLYEDRIGTGEQLFRMKDDAAAAGHPRDKGTRRGGAALGD